ncbi:MAG: signal peptide peptidase SppA [Proteobacteria bacterium]|nr:signal peptide peptidase SppA [Pseudomonadota bacterium]
MAAQQQSGGFWSGLRAVGRGINMVRLVIINVIFFAILLVILVAAGHGVAEVAPNSVLVLKPDGQLVEQFSIDPVSRALARMSGQDSGQVQVRDLVGVIDAAARDGNIKRILLEPDQLQPGGFAALEEVGAALDRFRKAGKQVYVWSAGMDQGQYLLAAHADRILLDPQGALLITGLSNYRSYYKDLLDKLGVHAHLFRVGQFKSAAEPFIQDAPSPASIEADQYWLGGLWDTWLTEVGKRRGIDANTLRNEINALPQEIRNARGDTAQLALQLHLVDELATPQQVVKLMQKLGTPDDSGNGFRGIDFDGYLPRVQGLAFGKPLVAVVVAEGDIVPGKQNPGTIGGESTSALIRAARNNRNVRAIVLRVNSPGGEVYAAEEIRREVQLAREAGKPVVVSMGDVAASGGYWISMDADRIFAEPDTITGSIGIFGLFFTAEDGLSKLGIHTDGVATAPLAGAFDIRRPLDPDLGAMIQSIIDKGYQDFVGGVARARGKSFADIDAIAQGRVWSGAQALQRGLVDQLGGLSDAIRLAAQDAKLGNNYAISYVEKPMSPFQRFLLNFGDGSAAHILAALGVRLPDFVAQIPKLAPELQLLQHAQAGKPQVYSYCFCTVR